MAAKAQDPIVQTEAQKFTFGDANLSPFDRLNQTHKANVQEAASTAASQAQSAQVAAGYNEETAKKRRWEQLMAKLMGGQKPAQDLSIPNLGR